MDTRLKRLRYRSWHRGCKETDLILGHFSDSGLSALAPAELGIYEQLLDEEDADIWNWLIDKEQAPEHYQPIIALLKTYNAARQPS